MTGNDPEKKWAGARTSLADRIMTDRKARFNAGEKTLGEALGRNPVPAGMG